MTEEVEQIIRVLRQELPRFEHVYHVKSLGLFGSLAHGKHTQESDADILVEFVTAPGLFEFLDLEEDLQRLLRRPVDLVEKKSLKPAIAEVVNRELIPV